jgi:ethanolamine kinase
MAPSGYIQSRQLGGLDPTKTHFATLVDNRPYLPNLSVDASDEASIRSAALAIVLLNAGRKPDDGESPNIKNAMFTLLHCDDLNWDALANESNKALQCTKITGGITNALFRVSGFQSLITAQSTSNGMIQQAFLAVQSANHEHLSQLDTDNTNTTTSLTKTIHYDSILIRIFGAEGMINRDIETSTYAALCRADIAHDYLGRFANGRIEGWLDGYQALTVNDLQCDDTSGQIAREMARLHCLFEIPEGDELKDHHGNEVGLWNQLTGWMGQALGYSEFKTVEDTERVRRLDLGKIEREVNRFVDLYTAQQSTSAGSDNVAFCHNDMLAANIMRDPATNEIQLIDFEYGGTNYKAFDIANHFNEHAGGTTAEEGATPDYNKFPREERQKMFCMEYVKKVKELKSCDDGDAHQEAMDLLDQVKEFVLINHLYWGLWAVNQAAEEGCEEFDYITYATNRFNQFYKQKSEWEGKK